MHPATVFVQRAEDGSVRKQPRLLQLGVVVSGLGSVVDHVAKQVVPAGAVATATADQGMVAEAVEHAIATRTFVVALSKRYPKPAPEHADEQGWFVVELSVGARSSLQE